MNDVVLGYALMLVGDKLQQSARRDSLATGTINRPL